MSLVIIAVVIALFVVVEIGLYVKEAREQRARNAANIAQFERILDELKRNNEPPYRDLG